jgi:hypothetical protein
MAETGSYLGHMLVIGPVAIPEIPPDQRRDVISAHELIQPTAQELLGRQVLIAANSKD